MTINDVSTRMQFHLWTIVPFGIALWLLAFLPYGCEQKAQQQAPKATVTTDNLQTAYAKSIRHQRMYTRFVRQAEKEKLANIANLYRAIAQSESIHALNHATLLRTRGSEPKLPDVDSIAVGTTLQTFKMALSSEDIETESMYPNLIRTAGVEKDTVARDQFQKSMEADARQTELLKDASDRVGKIPKIDYYLCPGCGYIITSSSTEECPVCHAAKIRFEKV